MNITVYGNLETCVKCKILHGKLDEKKIQFIFIDDKKEVMKIASDNKIMSIPIMVVEDEKAMTFAEAIKYVNEVLV